MIFSSAFELLFWVKQNSPFYQELYSCVSAESSWTDVPIVDQSLFWQANRWDNNRLLTSKTEKGFLFKSGGTTGKPKFSYFSKDEWEHFCQFFGEAMGEANLRDGDRVGNLFYAGELYASFLFINKSLEYCPRRIIQFPFAGKTPFDELAASITEFNINVLCGVPTSFLQFAQYCIENNLSLSLERLLYGGEALYPDQLALLKEAFPKAKIHSVGYASVDGGLLGKRSADCKGSEHRVFSKATLMEIVDEEGQPITEPGVEGRLLLTNLSRRLMPIIRYPVGDQAEWVEVGEKFCIKGRSQEGARIGPITLNRDDLVSIFESSGFLANITHFQMEITHRDGLDQLEIKIVEKYERKVSISELEKVFYEERKMFRKAVSEKVVHPVLLTVCEEDSLYKNPRTGKGPVIVDKRLV
jgi:phenylacetate-CoA ligase